MPPFLGYYHLPSLWSNYFSTQISAVFFLTLGFLQPISMFYWCKIKLHSVPWFSPCSPLAHKISVVYRPTIFSPAPWACFEVLRNLDLPSLFRLIYYYPLCTLTSSHTWLFEGFRIFSPVLLLFLPPGIQAQFVASWNLIIFSEPQVKCHSFHEDFPYHFEWSWCLIPLNSWIRLLPPLLVT